MTLNLDDLTVTTFATGPSEGDPGLEALLSRSCPISWASNCEYTCVTCNGCESGPAGAC